MANITPTTLAGVGITNASTRILQLRQISSTCGQTLISVRRSHECGAPVQASERPALKLLRVESMRSIGGVIIAARHYKMQYLVRFPFKPVCHWLASIQSDL